MIVKNGIGQKITDLNMKNLTINVSGRTVGRNLKRARRAMNIGQKEFGRLLGEELRGEPYSEQAISKWELGGRQDFSEEELAAFTKILKRDRDFFVTTENEISSGNGIKTIEPIDDSEKSRIPLISFEQIQWDVMDRLIEFHKGKFHKTSFRLPKKRSFAFDFPNHSMEPRIGKGARVSSVRGLKFEPEQVVIIQIGEGDNKEIVIGTYFFENDNHVVRPENPKWKKHQFTSDRWEKDVRKIAVLAVLEIPLLVDFPPDA